MKGMRSYSVREKLIRFALSKHGQPLEIVSYDVAGHDHATAMAVYHFIFGAVTRSQVNGGTKEYRYPGLLSKPGVVWLGQSVFLLTQERFAELRAFLERRGVAYGRLSVRTS